MQDSTLIKISLAWSLIGIFALILVANFTQPEHIAVKDLQDYLGKTVVLQGSVTKATYRESVSFIDLKDETGTTAIVLFENLTSKVYPGDLIAVRGKIQLYKNEPELVAEEIFCVKCGT